MGLNQTAMLRAAAVAALIAFVAALGLAVSGQLPDSAARVQPSVPPAPPDVFPRATNAYPAQVLVFFAAGGIL